MSACVVVSGSPSVASKTAILAEHVRSCLETEGMAARRINLRMLPVAALAGADLANEAIADAVREVEDADGVVFVTPIYKASFSGYLKLFIDLLPQYALAGKTVMPLATGGTPAHVLALDYGLRPVLQSMGARQIVQSYFLLQSEIDPARSALTPQAAMAPLLAKTIADFCAGVSAHRLFMHADGGLPVPAR